MKEPVEDIVAKGILRSTKDIVLSNDMKKQFKEAVIFDSFDSNVVNNYNVHAVNVDRMLKITKF